MRPLLISIVPFITICSSIYHLTYWANFGIDGLFYISISNIIKSSAYPTIASFGLFFVSILTTHLLTERVFEHGAGRDTQLGKKLNSRLGVSIGVLIWLILSLTFFFVGNSYRWFYWALIVGIVPFLYFDRTGLFNSLFQQNIIRINVLKVLIYIPLFSFAIGKYKSERVLNNVEYQYISQPSEVFEILNSNSSKLKIIGITEQYLFVSEMDNSNLTMLKMSDIKALRINTHYNSTHKANRAACCKFERTEF